ncbi:MAG: hypothetical protein Q8L55_01190 [Phycisphaerales bacterium]|nr:hypothetical protein [Phycisphaerales bacterium]
MHGTTHTPSVLRSALQTQASALTSTHRARPSLATVGSDIAAAARVAAALHMAESAPRAQFPRDQASQLRDLVASISGQGAAK